MENDSRLLREISCSRAKQLFLDCAGLKRHAYVCLFAIYLNLWSFPICLIFPPCLYAKTVGELFPILKAILTWSSHTRFLVLPHRFLVHAVVRALNPIRIGLFDADCTSNAVYIKRKTIIII